MEEEGGVFFLQLQEHLKLIMTSYYLNIGLSEGEMSLPLSLSLSFPLSLSLSLPSVCVCVSKGERDLRK